MVLFGGYVAVWVSWEAHPKKWLVPDLVNILKILASDCCQVVSDILPVAVQCYVILRILIEKTKERSFKLLWLSNICSIPRANVHVVPTIKYKTTQAWLHHFINLSSHNYVLYWWIWLQQRNSKFNTPNSHFFEHIAFWNINPSTSDLFNIIEPHHKRYVLRTVKVRLSERNMDLSIRGHTLMILDIK